MRVITKVVDHWQQLPIGLNSILHVMPKPLLEQLFGAALNRLFNPECQHQQFAFLHQHWVQIQVPDLSLTFAVTAEPTATGTSLRVSMRPQRATVTMRSNSAALLLLISGDCDPDTLFFRRKLLITGDTELGLAVKNLLDTVELDERLPGPLVQATKSLAKALQSQPGQH